MKIALALEYPLMQQGGTEVLVQELVRGLSKHFEVILVSGDKERAALPREYDQLIGSHLSWDFRAATNDSARGLAEAMRRQGIELAHFHLGGTFAWGSNRFPRSPILYLARSGIPCLTTNHLAARWRDCGVNPDRPAWQRICFQGAAAVSRSLVYRRIKLEVCVSRHDHARVVRMFPFFRGKITQRYHSLLAAEAPPPDLEHRDPVILCVGTIGGRKAQPLLTDAFAGIATRHPQWQLDLVGRNGVPEDVQRIQDCVARFGLARRVNLLGRLSDEETLVRMQRASIIAMPSLEEGLGLSLQEGLFHGCVGVGSRAGGIPELIDHETNGLLVPPGDVSALAAALDRLLSQPALLEKLRAQCRPSILRKGMTLTAMVESYRELYRKYLGRPLAKT
jgi:glycosyltransferase involved in cell wall biosynthesis